MAEYQYYEFRTVNRALTREEQAEVNTWSSRGNVSPTSAAFVYHYGDFKRDPEKCLIGYFDMMLYFANYGCRRMMFRFPEHLVDFQALKKYVWENEDDYEHEILIFKKEKFVVVDIAENLEEGFDGWFEVEGVLPGLTSLWTDICNGNYACLYLAWAHFAASWQEILDDMDEEDEDDSDDETSSKMPEPPVPAGLKKPSAALREFMEFWEISDDLRVAAAQNSPQESEMPLAALENALDLLSPSEKTAFLARLLRDEPHLRSTLAKRLQDLAGKPAAASKLEKPRGIRDLLAAESKVSGERMEREKKEAAEKRRLELEAMKSRERAMWQAVRTNLLKKNSSGYTFAVNDLKDLRDLADYTGTRSAFDEKMAGILEEFGRSSSLKGRLRDAGLA